jgi:hypothetical protein
VIAFDELKKNPQEIVNKCCEFLGVRTYKISNDNKVSNKTQVKSDFELRIKGRYSFVLKFIPMLFKDQFKVVLRKLSKNTKLELSTLEVKTIKQQLEKDMFQFEEAYNFDVSKWGFLKNGSSKNE